MPVVVLPVLSTVVANLTQGVCPSGRAGEAV
jgi:hypothetical protein